MRDEERFIRGLAGTAVVSGLALGWYVDRLFYLLNLFVGLNLIQSTLTDFCPPEEIYLKFRSGEKPVLNALDRNNFYDKFKKWYR